MAATGLRAQIRRVKVDDIEPAPSNVKRHDVALMVESIRRFGFADPLIVDQRTGKLLAGHGRLAALRQLRDGGEGPPAGINSAWEVPVYVGWASQNDADADAARIALNRTTEAGGWDEPALLDLLDVLAAIDGGLVGVGYDAADIDELRERLSDIAGPATRTDPDDVPDAPADPITQLGDVWLLGKHRLVCGDATDGAVLDGALDGSRAELVWTDPPYGVAYVGKTKDALTIENDQLDPEKLEGFLRLAFGAVMERTRKGACWYVAAPPGPLFLPFAQVLLDLGVWRQTLVWVKDQFVMGRSDYHYRHEPIFYGWSPGAAHRPPGDRKQDTIMEVARPRRSAEHPTMKPVELVERALSNSSKHGAVVLDPFAGSGSTLIASHRTGRVARLVELDPSYCDVICRRYQEHTGEKPTLEATGEPRDFA